MVHVLVVDDEPALLRAITMNLTGRGYQVSAVGTGAAALQLAATGEPDLVLLDLGLPDIHGTEVIRQLRQTGNNLPIIVVSAQVTSDAKVTAFDLGATDYITKPFDVNELLARLRAALRRADTTEPDHVVQLGPTTIDLDRRTITRHGPTDKTVHLTPTEWRMLETLLRHPDTVVASPQLLMAMRGSPDHTEASYLRSYMQQLRQKLEPDPTRPRYLITEPGFGYRFRSDQHEPADP